MGWGAINETHYAKFKSTQWIEPIPKARNGDLTIELRHCHLIFLKLGVNSVGNQEIDGSNQAYLKVEKGRKSDFHWKNNVLKKLSQQILAEIRGFRLIQKQRKVSTVSHC
jgi:hypothetical protein